MINKEILAAYLNANNCSYVKTGAALGFSKQYVYQLIQKFNIEIQKKAVIKP